MGRLPIIRAIKECDGVRGNFDGIAAAARYPFDCGRNRRFIIDDQEPIRRHYFTNLL